MDFVIAMYVLLFKNIKGVFPIEGFRLEMYLREFTRHCVVMKGNFGINFWKKKRYARTRKTY